MSQAETLLNGLTDNITNHNHVMSDSDSHFVIDPDTRKINNAGQTETVLIQYDHNSEVFTFELPRYIDGHDMTLCNRVRVHYNNVDGKTKRAIPDVHEMTDLRVSETDPDKVISSWLITRNATQLAGTLNFLVQYMCVDDEDNVVYEWHTDIYDGVYVNSGRRNNKQAVVRYSDVLEQWYQRLFDTGESVIALAEEKIDEIVAETNEQIAIAKQEIESKAQNTLDMIPSNYVELYDYANEAARTKGDAVTHTVEGEALSVSDSSDDYLRGLRVFGKTTQVKTTGAQLLPIYDAPSKTDRGLTQIIEDGVCIVKGTASSNASFNLTLAGAYSSTNVIFTLTAGTYTAKDCIISSYDGTTRKSYQNTFTLTDTIDITWVATRSYGATEVVDEITRPMLNTGNQTLPLEPYTGGFVSPSPEWPQELTSVENPTVGVYGKNLVKVRNFSSNGYKVTVNDDGSITVTGAATTTDAIYLMVTPYSDVYPLVLKDNVDYFMWSESSNGKSIGTKSLDAYGNQMWSNIENWNDDILHKANRIVQFYLESKGQEVGDTSLCGTYKIQLEVGNKFTGFEGYKELTEIAIPRTLPGIPVSQNGNYTDADGNQWICDEVDFERGLYIQRVGIKTINGSIAPTTFATGNNGGTVLGWQYDGIGMADIVQDRSPKLCDKLLPSATSEPASYKNCEYGRWGFNTKASIDSFLLMNVGTFATANEAKQWFVENPVTFYYVLATHKEHPLTETELQAFRNTHSNYPSTTVLNDSGAHMELKYNVDTELFIKNTVPRPTDEQVDVAFTKYAANNDIASDEQVRTAINDYVAEHGMATDEQVKTAITDYANKNGIAVGATTAQATQIEQNKTNVVMAQTAANNASTAATNAQSTANTAVTAAQNAQKTANEANQKVDTLRGIVSKLHSNIVQEVKGKVITVSDASDMPLAGLKVFGKTEQFTTTGKNLVDITKAITDRASMELKSDGEIRVYSDDAADTYKGASIKQFVMRAGQSYTLSADVKSVARNAGIALRRVADNMIIGAGAWCNVAKTLSLTRTVDADTEAFVSLFVCGAEAGSGDNTFANVQVELGSTATAYEPYTGGKPSPSPEYPQELESVGDDGSLQVQIHPAHKTVENDTLYGIPVTSGGNYTDSTGQQWICDEVDFEKGVYVKRIEKIVLDETISVTKSAANQGGYGHFIVYLGGVSFFKPETGNGSPVLSTKFGTLPNGDQSWGILNTFFVNTGNNGLYFVMDKPDVESAKIALVGTEIYYVRVIEKITHLSQIDPNILAQYAEKYSTNTIAYGTTHQNGTPTIDKPVPLVNSTEVVQSMLISTPNGLPGIPVSSGGNYTDPVTGKQWICDEVDFEKGVYLQRVKRVNLDDMNIGNAGGVNFFYNSPDKAPGKKNLLCTHYPVIDQNVSGHDLFVRGDPSGKQIYIIDKQYTTEAALKEARKGMKFLYELETPIPHKLSEIDPDVLTQYAELHSNYPNTTVFNDRNAWMEVKYVADTQIYVDNKFKALEAAIANLI